VQDKTIWLKTSEAGLVEAGSKTPRKPLNKYWCSVPHYLSDIRNIYIKADRFPSDITRMQSLEAFKGGIASSFH
jgi:hypothetical protein